MERAMTARERRLALGGLGLLAAIVVVDVLSEPTILISLLVVVPVLAALASPPRIVIGLAALTFATAVVMGAVDGLFLAERHIVGLLVVAAGGVASIQAARSRGALSALRETESEAFRRIALLDRSSLLIAAPMEFGARLRELTRLVIPDLADLAMIDLTTADGRLDGVVAGAADPEQAALVERTRAALPIDPAGDHPVAVALRTGEPQLRGAMTDDTLAYSSAIVIPLIARGSTLGVLSVLRLGTAVPFAEADVSLISDLASRAALAVDNARLFEEQQRTEAQLQTVLDGLAEPVVMVSREGELVYVNDAAAALFDADGPPTRLSDVHAGFELFDEQGAPLDPDALPGRKVLRGEPAEPVTYRRRHLATGEEQWLTVKASAAHDPATGEPIIAVNIIEDVTEQRQAHERAAFLSDASRLLSASLEFESTLEDVARAVVPRVAPWCAIDVENEGERLDRVAVAGDVAGEPGLVVPLISGERVLGSISLGGTPDRELAEELGRRAGVAVENARIHQDRSRIAATLQRSLLPPRLPVVPGLTLAARFRAAGEANQVGGDFYDLFPIDGDWMVVIGDVTGKGPGAAAITSLARYTIRTAALYEPTSAGIMRRLNDVLLAEGDRPQMCTAVCVRITPATGLTPLRAELVCAGHPPPYLLHGGGGIEELCRPGPLLGAFAHAGWEPFVVDLHPGDGVVLYTDGVTDARGSDGLFGQARLEALLGELAGAEADAIAGEIDDRLLAFQEGPQRDDVALLVLRAGAPASAPETTVVAGSSATAT
ncbi:MAG: SpoIIE family protein phosphatase [Solirubrobacteraceae bacterium]